MEVVAGVEGEEGEGGAWEEVEGGSEEEGEGHCVKWKE